MTFFIITIEEVWDGYRVSHKPEVILKCRNKVNRRLQELYTDSTDIYRARFGAGYEEKHYDDGGFTIFRSYNYDTHHYNVQMSEHDIDDETLRKLLG